MIGKELKINPYRQHQRKNVGESLIDERELF